MSRNERITIYVSEEEKKHLKSEADAEGETLSSYLYKLIQEQRRQEGIDRAATTTLMSIQHQDTHETASTD